MFESTRNAVEVVPVGRIAVSRRVEAFADLSESRTLTLAIEAPGDSNHANSVSVGVKIRTPSASPLPPLCGRTECQWQYVELYDVDLEEYATALLAAVHHARTHRLFPGLVAVEG